MRALLLILFVIVTKTDSQVCDEKQNTVELKDRTYNGIKYEDGEYFVDNTTGVERGCVCMKEICVQKCCHFGKGFDYKTFTCVDLPDKFDPPVWDGSELNLEFNATKEFNFFKSHMNCLKDPEEALKILTYEYHTEDYHLLTDGRLYFRSEEHIPSVFEFKQDKYCIDNFLKLDNTVTLDALVCLLVYKEPHHLALNASCMLVSCFFFVLTVAVYLILPNLRNSVHGRVMIAYLMCFFVDFLCMATMQILLLVDSIDRPLCTTLTFVISFSMLSGFFWLNVMCYDLWRKFKTVNVTTHGFSSDERTKFLWYCAYAFGVPTAITLLMAAIEFSDLKYHKLLPNIRRNSCFIGGISKFIYLYLPMLIVLLVNMVFIALLTKRIIEIKKQTQRLQKKDAQQFALYVKLFVVSGINWVLEAISSFYPNLEAWWRIPDAYNILLGVIIFIIFVFKKSILVELKNRYKQIVDQNQKATRTKNDSTNSIAITSQNLQPQENIAMKSNENVAAKNK